MPDFFRRMKIKIFQKVKKIKRIFFHYLRFVIITFFVFPFPGNALDSDKLPADTKITSGRKSINSSGNSKTVRQGSARTDASLLMSNIRQDGSVEFQPPGAETGFYLGSFESEKNISFMTRLPLFVEERAGGSVSEGMLEVLDGEVSFSLIPSSAEKIPALKEEDFDPRAFSSFSLILPEGYIIVEYKVLVAKSGELLIVLNEVKDPVILNEVVKRSLENVCEVLKKDLTQLKAIKVMESDKIL